MTDLINKSTRTWTPARTPAARASGGGDSLPASAASRDKIRIYQDDFKAMRIIEDFHEMERQEDRMASGWWIIPFAIAGALIGAGLGLLIIRWLI